MGWYRQFREEITLHFPTIGKNSLPPYFQAHIEAEIIVQSYGTDHLYDLNCKIITEYIHNTLITELVNKEATTKMKFLKRYNLTKICDATVLKCMHLL